MAETIDRLRIESREPATLSEASRALGHSKSHHVSVLQLIILGDLKAIIRTDMNGNKKIMVDPAALADLLESRG